MSDDKPRPPSLFDIPGPYIESVPVEWPPLDAEADLQRVLERQRGLLQTQHNIAYLKASVADWARRHELPVPPVFIARGFVHVGKLDEYAFEQLTGRPPVDDDLLRVNCLEAGKPFHTFCGWCDEHGLPCFECAPAHEVPWQGGQR